VGCHPGSAATDLGRHLGVLQTLLPLVRLFLKSAAMDAWAALQAAATGRVTPGGYYGSTGLRGIRRQRKIKSEPGFIAALNQSGGSARAKNRRPILWYNRSGYAFRCDSLGQSDNQDCKRSAKETMTHEIANAGQIRLERRSPSYWRVTFDLPPLNIFGPKNIPQLNEIGATST
jgi:hypothetical protein